LGFALAYLASLLDYSFKVRDSKFCLKSQELGLPGSECPVTAIVDRKGIVINYEEREIKTEYRNSHLPFEDVFNKPFRKASD
jgi:hypothetical protein